MSFTCSRDRIGASQNEQGCKPSSAQIILPQLRQLGAVEKSGWIEALQSHLRRSDDSEGFVDSSRAAIAEVRSAMLEVVVVAPLPRGVDVPD